MVDPSTPERPRALVPLTAATAIAALACLVPGLRLLPAPEEPAFPPWFSPQTPGPLSLPWLVAFVLGAAALAFVWKRGARAPAWLLLFWTVGLSLVPNLVSSADHVYFRSGDPPDTHFGLILELAWEPAQRALLFVALVIPWLLVVKHALSVRFRAWFASSAEAVTGYAPSGRIRRSRDGSVLLALVLFSFWRTLWVFRVFEWQMDPSYGVELLATVENWLFGVLDLLAFATCAGLMLWRRFERLALDAAGVRLFVFRPGFSAFFAPWERVRSVELVEHDRGARCVVIHYRSRLWTPFSLGVHANRYQKGEEAIDELLAEAARRGVPIRRWRSPRRTAWFAWAMLALGLLLLIGQNLQSEQLMRRFADPEFPAQLDVLAGLFPLTALHTAAVLCLGLGFGLLSAHHRGGSRPVLLVLLAVAVHSLPDPLIHWLVWIASHAILSARLQPVALLPSPPLPPLGHWNLALTALQYAPLVVALGYYVGVTLGRRPK